MNKGEARVGICHVDEIQSACIQAFASPYTLGTVNKEHDNVYLAITLSWSHAGSIVCSECPHQRGREPLCLRRDDLADRSERGSTSGRHRGGGGTHDWRGIPLRPGGRRVRSGRCSGRRRSSAVGSDKRLQTGRLQR